MRNQQTKNPPASTSFTRLMDKHYSPMVVRKITKWGFPFYIGIITDDDISDFDDQIITFMNHQPEDWSSNIQKVRNVAGGLVEHLRQVYDKTEGAAVLIYADKCFVSSLHGDFMTHAACKQEWLGYLQMSIGV